MKTYTLITSMKSGAYESQEGFMSRKAANEAGLRAAIGRSLKEQREHEEMMEAYIAFAPNDEDAEEAFYNRHDNGACVSYQVVEADAPIPRP